MQRRWRAAIGVLAGLTLLASAVVVGSATPAKAQADCPPPDPYSGEQQCPRKITLVLDLQFGPAGTRLRIRAHGFNAGDPVSGTFNGTVVFQTNATPGTGQVALGGQPSFAAAGLGAIRSLFAQADDGLGGVDQTITVPNLPPATYPVCVSGSGAQACGEFRITPGTAVLGSSTSRDSDGSTINGTASGGTTSSGTKVLGQSFARTGIAVATLLLLAVSLIVAGRYLRVASRRRRSHA